VQELHEEYIDEQLQKYRSGMTMPRVSTQDFLKYIKVRVIPLEEQKAKVEAIRGVATKVAELEKEKEAALKGQTQQEYKEFASLKHTISQSLHKASTAVELLRGFIKDLAEEGASLPAMDAKIDDEGGPTMNDLFSTALRHLQVSSDILEENEQAAIDLSNYPLAPLNFKAFIKKTCAEEKKLPKTKFEMYLYIPEDTTDEGKIKKYINSHEELLGILFGNIFDNAKRHAFVDNNKKYKLRVEVRFAPAINNLPCVVVEIGNNGKPFPEKFGKEELITKNRKASNTGHSGIGGSDIDKIIKHHKGEFELLLGEDEEFVTIYQIKIPLVYDKG
jgi:type I restriction enzyme M protein